MLQVFPKYWALIIASILALGILLFVVFRLLQDSTRGQLVQALHNLRAALGDAGTSQPAGAARGSQRHLEMIREREHADAVRLLERDRPEGERAEVRRRAE